MKKTAQYLRVDINSRNSEGAMNLRAEFGAEGYGIKQLICETLACTESGHWSLNSIGALAMSIHAEKQKVSEVIDCCLKQGLFIKGLGDTFTSPDVLDFKKIIKDLSDFGLKGAKKRWDSENKNSPPISPSISQANTTPISIPSAKELNEPEAEQNKPEAERNQTKEQEQALLIEKLFNELPNTSHIETIALRLSIPKERVLTYIPGFRKAAELSYPTPDKFYTHFKNWIAKQINTEAPVKAGYTPKR